ncbi:MAG: hypothetical protein QMC37_02675, partial [Flavobacteriales bacterium]
MDNIKQKFNAGDLPCKQSELATSGREKAIELFITNQCLLELGSAGARFVTAVLAVDTDKFADDFKITFEVLLKDGQSTKPTIYKQTFLKQLTRGGQVTTITFTAKEWYDWETNVLRKTKNGWLMNKLTNHQLRKWEKYEEEDEEEEKKKAKKAKEAKEKEGEEGEEGEE